MPADRVTGQKLYFVRILYLELRGSLSRGYVLYIAEKRRGKKREMQKLVGRKNQTQETPNVSGVLI